MKAFKATSKIRQYIKQGVFNKKKSKGKKKSQGDSYSGSNTQLSFKSSKSSSIKKALINKIQKKVQIRKREIAIRGGGRQKRSKITGFGIRPTSAANFSLYS
jgi:hypothetical protein